MTDYFDGHSTDTAKFALNTGLNYDIFPADRVQPSSPPEPHRARPYRYQLTCYCGRSISLRATENATKKCRCGARASRTDGRITLELHEEEAV